MERAVTNEEFGQWVEQHYTELLAVAKQRISRDPEDALQAALARVTENLPSFDETKGKPWTWVVNAIRSSASNARVSRDNTRKLRRSLKKDPSASVPLGWKRPGVSRACSDPTKSWEDTR